MPNISLASKVAIAFLKPFRTYLDGRHKISARRKDIENDIRKKTEAIAQSAREANPNISEERIEYAREGFLAINMQLIDAYEKTYDKLLPEIIETMTLDLEKELKKSFTSEELRRVIELLSDETVKKFLTNDNLFAILKQTEIILEHKMRLETLHSSLKSEGIDKINNTLSSLKEKYGIDDNRPEDREDDEDNEDEMGNDFWQEDE